MNECGLRASWGNSGTLVERLESAQGRGRCCREEVDARKQSGWGRICWVTGIIWSQPLYLEGRERLKKKADRSRLIGGRFHKQENLHRRHAMGEHKTSGSLHLPPRILKVQTEALTGASQMHRGP